MSKFKKQQLFRVAKNLNVSVDSIVAFLDEKGYKEAYTKADPNGKITDEDAYLALLDEYSDDREAVEELRQARKDQEAAEKVQQQEAERRAAEEAARKAQEEAERRARLEAQRKAEEEAQRKAEEEAKRKAEEEAKRRAEQEAAAKAVAERAAAQPAPAEAKSAEADASDEAEQPEAAQPAEASAAEAETPTAESAGESETLRADRHTLAGTKVLGKIDLSQIQSGSRGRKRKRRGEEEPAAPKNRPAKKKVGGPKPPEVDQVDVEQMLQETRAQLQKGASRNRQKRRRLRREERAAERAAAQEMLQGEERVLKVTEFLSTGELAGLMDVGANEVVGRLFSMGMMVSINQRLDADTIQLVADEFGYEVEFIKEFDDEEVLEIDEDDPEDLIARSPVVTIMGHVDHGKTSLLDYIREANVVAGEAGGITQHIGAYKVDLDGREIAFLDTPGHEAFTAMRARGAQATDIVILVVAADDAVMPQTIEAINHAKAAEVPIVVAINKIDKPAANAPRVMQQLSEHGVLVEEYGGEVQAEQVSAKTGQGVPELLEKVLIQAELLELKANPDRGAVGTVIESRLDKGRGVVATVLVQTGTLEVGDIFLAGVHSGRVRAMFDERDNRVESAGPSTPVTILGFPGAPEVGDRLIAMDDEREARDIAQRRAQIAREQSMRQRKHITLDEIGRRIALGDFQELNVILKGDVGGSVEALSDSLQKLSTQEVVVSLVHTGVGAINESDVMLASASDAVIIGFQVRPTIGARALAEREEIDIRTYSIIYDAIQDVRDALEGLLSPEQSEKTLGVAEVRQVFKVPKAGQIAGSFVIDGKLKRGDKVRLIRDGVVIHSSTISSLRRLKDDVREVSSGYECGIGVDNYNDLKEGDQIEAFEIVETARTLEQVESA
jgi:translation initiation factor IF-2